MGSGSSKPPPVRTSVRNYPGSKGPPKDEGADPATFKGPRSETPRSIPAVSANRTNANAEDGEEHMEAPATPSPIVLTEDELLKKTSEDRDVMLDDGESVSGAKPGPELTTKEANRQQNAFGREEQTLEARHSERTTASNSRPEVASGELWTDPDYPQSVAMQGQADPVQWARPKGFLQNPCLYSDDTCRYDIEQGAVGTCWFLSVIQALADQPEYIKHIIPEGSYRIGTPEYDGIFHCRFWRFGEWVDVYVDDNIPVMHGKPWGARSRTDPNELWVTLMEKAFSKFHGSYLDATGGMAHRAFGSLTAGTSEVIELNGTPPKNFYRRVKNSLSCGSTLAASVLTDGEVSGLVGHHSYTITGVCKAVFRSKYVPLVRIRNPWGSAKGEWKGAWSDGAPEWSELSPKDKAAIQQTSGGDGEFWMSLTDFFQYFGNVSVCNYTPDVDLDGKTDDMNKTWNIYGEWKGEDAAGWKDKMKNPKFEFEIPKKGIPKAGTPVAIEFIQAITDRRSQEDLLNIRADLFKVESVSGDAGCQQRLLRELTSQTTYWGGESLTYRYPALGPGKYVVVPHYSQEPGVEKEFLLRIFSQVTLPCCEVQEKSGYFITTATGAGFEYKGGMQPTETESPQMDPSISSSVEVDRRHGAWVAGKNAGGQIGHRSVSTNPQYQMHIKHPGQLIEQPCTISLCQDVTKPSVPIGFRLFKRGKAPMPVDTDWMYSNFKDCPTNTEGNQGVFIRGPEATANYMLMPGDYIILVHCNDANQEASYVLQIATRSKPNMKEFNVQK